jgi:hypothetical protein
MPLFIFETNDDGTIRRVLKNGSLHDHPIVLEQHFSVVVTYFKIARRNLNSLAKIEDQANQRYHGLQSFLMSMTGLEAFTNTYFQQRAEELGKANMLARIERRDGSITSKIADLLEMSGDGPLIDQDALIQRLFELSQLRNEMTRPRWQPSELVVTGQVPIIFEGLVENRQALFEDIDFCREALNQCLLLVARVAQSIGVEFVPSFLFHWTGHYEISLQTILSELGLPEE